MSLIKRARIKISRLKTHFKEHSKSSVRGATVVNVSSNQTFVITSVIWYGKSCFSPCMLGRTHSRCKLWKSEFFGTFCILSNEYSHSFQEKGERWTEYEWYCPCRFGYWGETNHLKSWKPERNSKLGGGGGTLIRLPASANTAPDGEQGWAKLAKYFLDKH
jgi:hypothetical protein